MSPRMPLPGAGCLRAESGLSLLGAMQAHQSDKALSNKDSVRVSRHTRVVGNGLAPWGGKFHSRGPRPHYDHCCVVLWNCWVALLKIR